MIQLKSSLLWFNDNLVQVALGIGLSLLLIRWYGLKGGGGGSSSLSGYSIRLFGNAATFGSLVKMAYWVFGEIDPVGDVTGVEVQECTCGQRQREAGLETPHVQVIGSPTRTATAPTGTDLVLLLGIVVAGLTTVGTDTFGLMTENWQSRDFGLAATYERAKRRWRQWRKKNPAGEQGESIEEGEGLDDPQPAQPPDT